jgi:gamma-glutamyltranspeptidase/glutathione hydrolase
MILFPHRPLRAVTVAVVALALGLAGCAGGLPGPWASAGRAVTPSPDAVRPPMARGPFVSAANPLAVEAGLKILREGGSAVDAAVAVQAVWVWSSRSHPASAVGPS